VIPSPFNDFSRSTNWIFFMMVLVPSLSAKT
jgi:hypothetical protein